MNGKSVAILVLFVLLPNLCLRPAAGRLVAHYQLDEGRGIAITDTSGNGHDGTLVGSGAGWVDGPAGFGKALHFPGTAPSPLVSTGRWDPSANTDRLSVAVWIKWEGPTAYYQGIVSKRDSWSATDTCWGLSLDQATGNITFSRYNCYPSFGTHIPPINEWQEIVVTFDGGTTILYTNGQEVGRSSGFSLGPKRDANVLFGDADAIGWNPFHGTIDEVRIYDEALPAPPPSPLWTEPNLPAGELLPPLAKGQRWRLVWHDEFDGPTVEPTKWQLLGDWQRRDGYWVQADSYLDGQGHLVLRTKRDGNRYTSGAVSTQGKFEHRYGYWVCRCQFPKETGHWPAFWLMADSVSRVGDAGRDGTEIDIVEKPWRDDRTTQNLHWDGYGTDHRTVGTTFNFPGVHEGFHTFGLYWTPQECVFYVDGVETWRTSGGGVAQVPEYVLLTEEIGTWGGDITQANLPDQFLVDHVRVYDIVSESAAEPVLVSEDFESGGFSPNWQHAGNRPWWVASSDRYAGQYSARAGIIGNGQTSSLMTTGLCSAGTFTFEFKTSTEPADKLAFYLDEQKMGEWSGQMPRWTRASYPLTAGTHTFEWRYVKNVSGASGADTVWIDEVTFPKP